MSYVYMDHAGWAESNIRAGKRLAAERKPRRDKLGNSVGMHAAPETLSPFQAKVMNILGIVGGGIYNAPISWNSIDWHCGRGVSLIWEGGLATADFNRLTMLVFLCHDARIRCEIDPAGPRCLRMTFHPRKPTGGLAERHRNLEEAVAEHRKYVPDWHSINYEPAAKPEGIEVVE